MSPEYDPEITAAGKILRANGVRLFQLDGVPTVGVWSDLDGAHIRAALARCGSGKWPVRYLDGPGIPMYLKVRRMKGTPVPLDIVAAMYAADAEHPWKVRDRMLAAIKWHPKVYVYGV